MSLLVALRIEGDSASAKKAIKEVHFEVDRLNKAVSDSNNIQAQIDRNMGIGGGRAFNDRRADVEAYGKALDTIRAKHNPLFAAQQQYKASLTEIKQAHAVGAISADEMAAAIQRQKNAFAGQVGVIRGHTNGLKLNQQQLMNMQFQMNDIAVMLASGQSPFVLMMQQGMQIGQIFGPGASVGQALKATGAGIVSFLTNPIMLAVAASAVLAGGIGMMFDAFSGPEAEEAEDILARVNDRLDRLGPGWESAEQAARRYVETASQSRVEVVAGLNRSIEELEVARQRAMEDMYGAFGSTFERRTGALYGTGEFGEMRDIVNDLRKGELTADAFRRKMAEIRLSPETREEVRDLADELMDLSPVQIDLQIRGREAAIREAERVRQAFDLSLRERFAEGTGDTLGARLKVQADELARDAERSARQAERDAERAAREAVRRAEQREANRLAVADLEAEVTALQASGDEREELLAKLREEKDIRSAIAALGKEGTAAEIAAMRTLIPLKNDLVENNRRLEEAQREADQAARQGASEIMGSVRALRAGADAAELMEDKLLDLAFTMAEEALYMGLGGSANGGQSNWVQLLVGSLMAGSGGTGGAPTNIIPGMRSGGYTGGNSPDDVRGVVHGKEYVFDARSTERIGVANLEAMRQSALGGALKGYRSGGYVGGGATAMSAPTTAGRGAGDRPQINFNVVNAAGAQVSGDARYNDSGGVDLDLMVENATNKNFGKGAHNRAITSQFATRVRRVKR